MNEAEYINEICALRARLAEVEAERDELDGRFENLAERAESYLSRAETAEARLASVIALCDDPDVPIWVQPFVVQVLAAARGEGDRD